MKSTSIIVVPKLNHAQSLIRRCPFTKNRYALCGIMGGLFLFPAIALATPVTLMLAADKYLSEIFIEAGKCEVLEGVNPVRYYTFTNNVMRIHENAFRQKRKGQFLRLIGRD